MTLARFYNELRQVKIIFYGIHCRHILRCFCNYCNPGFRHFQKEKKKDGRKETALKQLRKKNHPVYFSQRVPGYMRERI